MRLFQFGTGFRSRWSELVPKITAMLLIVLGVFQGLLSAVISDDHRSLGPLGISANSRLLARLKVYLLRTQELWL